MRRLHAPPAKRMASKYFALLVALNVNIKRKEDRNETVSNQKNYKIEE